MYVANSACIMLEPKQDFQHCNWSRIQRKIQLFGPRFGTIWWLNLSV